MTEKDSVSSILSRCISEHSRYNIGTYKERTQHLVLKSYFEPDTSCHEKRVGKYIADIYNSYGICEIQTSGFDGMRAKLEFFLDCEKLNVTVVYPASVSKRIIWCDPATGDAAEGHYRPYPKAKYKLLSELLGIAELFGHDGLLIKLCQVKVSECRLLDGYGSDRKRRATKTDTLTDDIIEIIDIHRAADVLKLLPFESGDMITRAELSKSLGLVGRNLWRAVKFLTMIGVISECGKKGRAIIYKVNSI